MAKSKRGDRRTRWALGTLVALGIAVGMAVSPGFWTAATARSAWSIETAGKDASCTVGDAHRNPAYDPVNHYVYVPNPDSSNISVIKAPCTVVATISTGPGSEPSAAAFDPTTDYVWVTDYALDVVYVISGTKIVSTHAGFTGPRAIAFDPGSPLGLGCMIVADYLADGVTVICSGVSEVGRFFDNLGSFPTGSGPFAIAYDPVLNYLLVANYGSANVTVFEPANNEFGPLVTVGNSPTGSEPVGMAFDPVRGCVYIANLGSNDVTWWCNLGAGNSGTITGFDEPTSVTWSQAKLAVYVTNWGSGGLWAVGGLYGTSIVQKVQSVPGIEGSTYDTATNDLYVTNDETNTVYVYST